MSATQFFIEASYFFTWLTFCILLAINVAYAQPSMTEEEYAGFVARIEAARNAGAACDAKCETMIACRAEFYRCMQDSSKTMQQCTIGEKGCWNARNYLNSMMVSKEDSIRQAKEAEKERLLRRLDNSMRIRGTGPYQQKPQEIYIYRR